MEGCVYKQWFSRRTFSVGKYCVQLSVVFGDVGPVSYCSDVEASDGAEKEVHPHSRRAPFALAVHIPVIYVPEQH